MLRIAASPSDNGSCVPLLRVDQRRKQVTLSEPKDKEDTSLKSLGLTSIPKLFAFDAIFESSATKVNIFLHVLPLVFHSKLKVILSYFTKVLKIFRRTIEGRALEDGLYHMYYLA